MKKFFVFGLCAGLFLITSCKSSSESSYKASYEKAKSQKEAEGLVQANDPVEITPVVISTPTVVAVNDTVRSERVVLATGAAGSLKAYSVVCGSFKSKVNADGLKDTLVGEGYNAIVVQNPSTEMYRVVCGSFDSKAEAAQAKESFKANHPSNAEFQKAWLLYNN